ncbi:MAG: HNH endonuclease [Bdellovibrionales bacterium]
MTKHMQIHEKALEVAGRFRRAESDLIEILQQVDEHRVYLKLHCKSLYDYATTVLKLSDNVAYNFITVARKAKEVPKMKQEIQSGNLTVSKARKISSVITPSNQDQWLKMAIELPQKKLEQQVAKVSPREATPERIKFVSEDRLNLQMGISERLQHKLKRAQELESQRQKKHVSLEETLEAMLDLYLEKKDPVPKAEKLQHRANFPVLRRVQLRDQGQCTHRNHQGERCSERKWIDTHHIVPKSKGGQDTFENLTTLCKGHHRLEHSH